MDDGPRDRQPRLPRLAAGWRASRACHTVPHRRLGISRQYDADGRQWLSLARRGGEAGLALLDRVDWRRRPVGVERTDRAATRDRPAVVSAAGGRTPTRAAHLHASP